MAMNTPLLSNDRLASAFHILAAHDALSCRFLSPSAYKIEIRRPFRTNTTRRPRLDRRPKPASVPLQPPLLHSIPTPRPPSASHCRSAKVADYLFVPSWATSVANNASSAVTSAVSRPALRRSATPDPPSPRFRFGFRKTTSTSDIQSRMAAVQGLNLHASKDQVMDTRTPSPVHRMDSDDSGPTSPDYKPDLSAEVAMLSTKLVNAINFQTNLDDSLQQTRHELEVSRQKVAELEAEKQRLSNVINGGAYVKRSDMDRTVSNMQVEVASARAARELAEKAKKQTDNELENLTVSLFEEANKMVAIARKNTEASEKRNAQLTAQLRDTELLLASQQEQLQDLKGTMERLQDDALPEPSVPSTPITANAAMFDSLPMSSSALMDMTPEHPLFFTHILSPVLRNDTAAFADFQELLLLARRLGAHSRSNSSNNNNAANNVSSAGSMSSPNIPGAFSLSSNQSPSSIYGGSTVASMPALKDSKFYKRALTEDIEPTLRLDLAPGLSFLSRRSVLSSLLQGTLVVEPYPQNKHYFNCTLCGEQRRKEEYIRRHRFRMSEDDGVSKPLCDYCVSRLRSTCDFVSFLRMVRDGLWKCDNEHDQKAAWEESARLRERMFWSRLGGGVIPRLQQNGHRAPSVNGSTAEPASERESLERIPEGLRVSNARSESSDADGVPQIKVRVPTFTHQQDTSTPRTARPLSYVTPPGSSTNDDEPSPRPATSAGGDVNGGGSSSPQFEDASEQLDRELGLAIEEAGAKDITPIASKLDEVPSTQHSRSASKDSTTSSRHPSLEKPSNRNSAASWSKRASLPVTPAAERNGSIPNSSTSNNHDHSPSPSHSRSASRPKSFPVRPARSPSPLKTRSTHSRHGSRDAAGKDNELDAERKRWSKRASVQSVTAAAERERGESVVSVVESEADEEDGEGEGGGQDQERKGRLAVEEKGVEGGKSKERKGSSVLDRVRAMERS
ncbi:unnamed protein product [Zymoseptoria tritici ST99CH_1A5]|uniref:GDP/GTP exchange factor Sec2 N-terminal domain-containing protein n=1 Tax=Zymoseptoria tritici ST99CH_1A5 TaxID=1276529 RepID=A0A1Y6M2B7_ZYMTR|nr:unnamed protein product [Zymoseptoria tritici ST99CH_1A5]